MVGDPSYADSADAHIIECGDFGEGVTSARLEAFSDGVLSIAATLLVLELHVPDLGQDLGQSLVAQSPSYAAYVVSFAMIGIIWVNHHSLLVHVRRVDRALLFLNLARLMVVSVSPFPTAMLGRLVSVEPRSHIVAAIYGSVMILMSLAFTTLWRHVTRDARLPGRDLDPRARRESVHRRRQRAGHPARVEWSLRGHQRGEPAQLEGRTPETWASNRGTGRDDQRGQQNDDRQQDRTTLPLLVWPTE